MVSINMQLETNIEKVFGKDLVSKKNIIKILTWIENITGKYNIECYIKDKDSEAEEIKNSLVTKICSYDFRSKYNTRHCK